MVSEYLPVYGENAGLSLLELLPFIEKREANFQISLLFCQNYRIKGISDFLLECDTNKLAQNLSKSAWAFVYCLKFIPKIEHITSQFVPFFDAIACGDFDAATSIAKLSPEGSNFSCEYEDDFLYFKFLMQYFLGEKDETFQKYCLNRYEELLGSNVDPRFSLCQSFFFNDESLFNKALEDFLSVYDDRYRRLEGSSGIAPEIVATEGYVCIEGLALVKIAELLGLNVNNEYLLIPTLIRNIDLGLVSPDSWRHPE